MTRSRSEELKLRRAVEGRPTFIATEFPASGSDFLSPDAAGGEGAKPSAAPLAAFLRSDAPISPELRAWIADMLDEGGDTIVQLRIGQRDPGRSTLTHVPGTVRRRHAAAYAETLVAQGRARKQAYHEASELYGLSERVIAEENRRFRAREAFAQFVGRALSRRNA